MTISIQTEPAAIIYEKRVHQDREWGIDDSGRHFLGDSDLFRTLREFDRDLESIGVSYATAGGMAVFMHGYRRLSNDLNILVTREGLSVIHKQLVGERYRLNKEGSRHIRDNNRGVLLQFQVTGEYPGDGTPTSVAFPDPTDVAIAMHGANYVGLKTLITMKLASGMTDRGRLKDLGDVIGLIQALELDISFAKWLHPYVAWKFSEMWTGINESPKPDWLEEPPVNRYNRVTPVETNPR